MSAYHERQLEAVHDSYKKIHESRITEDLSKRPTAIGGLNGVQQPAEPPKPSPDW